MRLTYTINFVDDMQKAIDFYKDRLGLALRFQSPEWSEFDTGPTTLALHLASPKNPAGTFQLGFAVPDIDAAYARMKAIGVEFTSPPTELHGSRIARFRDSQGSECSVSGK